MSCWREYQSHIPNSYWTFEPSPSLESYIPIFHEAKMWCEDQFGPSGQRWWPSGLMLSFSRQADAAAFKMRWC